MPSNRAVRNPIFARFFVRLPKEDQLEYRLEMLRGLSGRVVDVGAGDGANFDLFPEEVTEVIAVEPEPYMRARAEENAARAKVPITRGRRAGGRASRRRWLGRRGDHGARAVQRAGPGHRARERPIA